MNIHELRSELWLPRPLDEVFPFFADAANLELITPPFLKFHIEGPMPVEMKEGSLINYRLKVRGIPMRWQSEITVWEPGRRFVDEQRKGPYRMWCHEHSFEERDGGTVARDHVRYAVPLDFIVHPLFVAPDVKRIFAYRKEKMEELFGD